MKISKLLAAISAVATFAGASQVTAQEMQPGIFMVPQGASQKIDRHGVCRTVKNGGANPIMVPAGTPQQWSNGQGAFLNNISNMCGVSVSGCGPSPAVFTGEEFCTGMYIAGSCLGRGAARMSEPRADGIKTVEVLNAELIAMLDGSLTTTCLVDGVQGVYPTSNNPEYSWVVYVNGGIVPTDYAGTMVPEGFSNCILLYDEGFKNREQRLDYYRIYEAG